MFYVYIIQSISTKSFYIGFTRDIAKRVWYHNQGLNYSTKNKSPWKLVYKEVFESKTEAIKRERFLKRQKNRNFYEKLISGIGAVG